MKSSTVKRILSTALAISTALAVSGCGESKNPKKNNSFVGVGILTAGCLLYFCNELQKQGVIDMQEVTLEQVKQLAVDVFDLNREDDAAVKHLVVESAIYSHLYKLLTEKIVALAVEPKPEEEPGQTE